MVIRFDPRWNLLLSYLMLITFILPTIASMPASILSCFGLLDVCRLDLSLLRFDTRSILRCLDHWILGRLDARSDILFLASTLLALACSLALILGQLGLAVLVRLHDAARSVTRLSIEGAIQQTMAEMISLLPTILLAVNDDEDLMRMNHPSCVLRARTQLIGRWIHSMT